jgi:hypothetical protein
VNGGSDAPVWWRTSCVGFDLNAAGSKHVSFEAFQSAVTGAFAAWLFASCGSGPSARPSIDVRDLGPIACASATYDKVGPNQNVIVFRDDAWPHKPNNQPKGFRSPTIALTTVTFEPETGELYDADIELNSADYTLVPLDTPPSDPYTFDLQTVLTHEIGHFFGLAHSPVDAAVMNATGDSASGSKKRTLTQNDIDGICSIYPADRTRNVSTLVDPSGQVAAGACDPTPRHGFSATCN